MSARIVMVSATASGQGKTTVTAALARALVLRSQRVRVFKCGPDFIDPMLLECASRAPVGTLDMWMVGIDQCRAQLTTAAASADVILIEGVMGLYDGEPSSADLARALGVPVVAVIDASAMAQTAGAVVHGLRDYGPVAMVGVIANRVAGSAHGAMVAASLRGIALLASLPRQARTLPERQLGLVLPSELADLDTLLDQLAAQLDFNQAAWDAVPVTRIDSAPAEATLATLLAGTRIAVARDAAFAFLYPANLDTLRALGAQLIFFSPLADQPVPDDASAVYLPGGYPELHAQQLARASRWQASICAAHADGMPILAECGGMMALAESIVDEDGTSHAMAGLLPGRAIMQTRLAGIGPQAIETPQGILRGHTFHYSRLDTPLASVAHTVRHPSGSAGEAVYRAGSLTASYFHAWFPSCPAAIAALLSR
ncbi:MAG: cobyrinate a,c-diamide synthase [Pseudomonadota bacterium]